MDWTLIVEVLVAVIGGSVITRFLTFKEMKNGMKLDNEAKIEENKSKSVERWSNLCNELQDQIEMFQTQINGLNERLDKKDERIVELEDRCVSYRTKIDSLNTELTKATLLKCSRLRCENRKPPFGYTELTTDELMEQGEDEK